MEDLLEGIKQAINNKKSQCNGFFEALAASDKSRYNKPIWCDEKSYAGMLINSLQGYINANGAMPDPRTLSGIERLSENLKETELFNRFMREFGGGSELEFIDIIGNKLLRYLQNCIFFG